MDTSILNSIKKLLGLDPDYTPFDTDIIIHINTVLRILNQIGVGSKTFRVTGSSETWDEFLTGADDADLDDVITFVYLRVRMLFDPPSSGITTEAVKETINELTWRLSVAVDPGDFP